MQQKSMIIKTSEHNIRFYATKLTRFNPYFNGINQYVKCIKFFVLTIISLK